MKIEEEINYDEKDKQKKMVNTRQPVAWLKLTESSLTVSCSAFAETMVELHIFTIRIISILLSVGAAALSSNSSVPQQPTNQCPRKIHSYILNKPQDQTSYRTQIKNGPCLTIVHRYIIISKCKKGNRNSVFKQGYVTTIPYQRKANSS